MSIPPNATPLTPNTPKGMLTLMLLPRVITSNQKPTLLSILDIRKNHEIGFILNFVSSGHRLHPFLNHNSILLSYL